MHISKLRQDYADEFQNNEIIELAADSIISGVDNTESICVLYNCETENGERILVGKHEAFCHEVFSRHSIFSRYLSVMLKTQFIPMPLLIMYPDLHVLCEARQSLMMMNKVGDIVVHTNYGRIQETQLIKISPEYSEYDELIKYAATQ